MQVVTAAMGMRFSAKELANMGLPGLSGNRQNCASFITRIREVSPELVSQRSGRGGGYVVDIAALPEAARDELRRREAQVIAATRIGQDEADAIEHSQRQIATAVMPNLTARERLVMEARANILLSIDALAGFEEMSRHQAILAFVTSMKEGRLDREEKRILRVANDRAGGERVLSRSTVYAWYKARDARGIIGLVPEIVPPKKGLPAWFEAFRKEYCRPQKPSIAEALRAVAKTLPEGAPLPTEKQARRAIAKAPALLKVKGREGKLAMRARQAYVSRDVSDLLPTSVYVADGKTFDAEIAHPIHGQPFRPEITTILDAATRKSVGWSASLDENTFGVVDALRLGCETCGVPAIFYSDRGPGYRNKAMTADLTGFLGRAGITPMRALPYNSQAKGVIERLNQVYTAAAKTLPTYMGKDMDKEAKLLAFKTTRKELALTGQSRLLPEWQAFLKLISDTLAAYNDRPHSDLPKIHDGQLGRKRHMTPNELWAQKTQGFDLVLPDADELDEMFRPYVVRRTRRALVEWLGNSYFAIELEPHHGQDVVVGYDIHDARRVWVRAIDEVDGQRFPGKLIAVARFEGHKTRYVPLSYEQAAIEKRAKARLGRLGKKADVIEQELRPSVLLEQAPAIPLDLMPEPAAAPVLRVITPEAPREVPAGQRPIFKSDTEFARWVAGNGDKATLADRDYLKELLNGHSSHELLRLSGLDLNRLRSIARNEPESRSGTEETLREGQII